MKRIYLLALCLLLLSPHANALVNGEAPAADDKRFDAVAAFSQTSWLIDNKKDKHVHNWFGGAVLIAPDVVLFARHLLPANKKAPIQANQYMVRFRRHVDGSLGSRKAGPNSYHQVPIARVIPAPRSDLALGILAKPVEHIAPVKVHLDNTPLENQTCYLAGWGSESRWRGVSGPRKGLRIGQNKLSTNRSSARILSYKTETRENKAGKQAPYVIDENAVPNMHDSGGSIFITDRDGGLALCGIIATFSGGNYLPAADSDAFPLKAATQGARALIKALDARIPND